MWLPAEKIVLRNQRALLPGGKKIHERADRLSERAEEHRRRLERRRADDKEGIEDEDLP